RVKSLPEVPNICNQSLREVYKNIWASLAYVEVKPGDMSLLHNHNDFDEWYYILSGRGTMRNGFEIFPVHANDLVVVRRKTNHQLACYGRRPLRHLVFSTPPFNAMDVNLRRRQ
ncbi:MAG: cupin domain-containing protein, partial [Planctomycetes bacterium]|nr:cupin domain-containing protein [Planctomycetota bacterium]